MLGLIMMSAPLAIAVGLSAMAIIHVKPDHSAGGAARGASTRPIKELP